MGELATNGNGNGGMPAWILRMRQAAQAVVAEDDIKAIVEAQVKRAKNGDANAIKFVFDTVLGGGALKGATLVQHNYAEPTAAPVPSVPDAPGVLEPAPVPAKPVSAKVHAPSRNPFK